ncbi:efflux RND transporter periplasmic adaptor subunit [Rhodoligotrophos defluvii]|uniref:efflux RND transporter periplasmic adaptor subunit n=1 Tax=Rhodoligotrophos defluvii TaxID=2561934 RepID=UPI001485ABDD|nr:efflux RND transporter periplasmic adaptor subunit [Rhodoligotrophos defluvii]
MMAAALSPPAARAEAVPVDAAPVTRQPLSETLPAAGALAPNEAVVIRPQIDGRIAAIHFEEGHRVEQGALLFSLDDVLYKAQLDEAKANFALAKQNSDRATQLLTSRAGTERARDEALAQLRVAEARVAIAEKNLSETRIYAPFAGEVGLRTVSVGAYVSRGDDLVELIQTDPLKVTFQLPERVLRHLGLGQPVDVAVDALPGDRFAGKVTVIAPQVTSAGRSLQLRAEIPNREGRLKPGLFARVSVTVSQRQDALFVPETALVPKGSDQFVYRIVEGLARETKVAIGVRQAGLVEVMRGLQPSDVVVTAGQMKLRDGDAVEIVGGPAFANPQQSGPDNTEDRTGARAAPHAPSRS